LFSSAKGSRSVSPALFTVFAQFERCPFSFNLENNEMNKLMIKMIVKTIRIQPRSGIGFAKVQRSIVLCEEGITLGRSRRESIAASANSHLFSVPT
jgi:hypothetical protein